MLRLFLASTALVLATAGARAQTPPSFVVITLDDVEQSRFSAAMVGTLARTAGRTEYPKAFTNLPLCGPSRAAFLTGQEAETSGIDENSALDWGTGFLPQALRNAGYRTNMVGKMPNGYMGTPEELGFSRYSVIEEIGEARYYDAVVNENGTLRTLEEYTTDYLYSRARTCVKGSKPYFCWVAAIGAHAPALPAHRHLGGCDNKVFQPGPAFNEADMGDKPSWMQGLEQFSVTKAEKVEKAWRDQCATLLADDEGVVSLLDLVEDQPDVCVILTSDNGRLYGQHRLTGKSVLYEESIRVPLYTWNCGTSPGVDNRLISNVDLPAHILDLAGVPSLRPLDGRPLMGEERTRVRIVGGTEIDALGWRRTNSVEWEYSNRESEYYDLRSDPHQLNSGVIPTRRKK
jgi:N-acetylglucosamine-6-sulfatase